MKLLTFAHRAESQAFLKNKALSFKAKPFAFEGFYCSEKGLALLITGEGVQSATEKLAAVCGAYPEITHIINMGVAGILEDSPKLEINQIKVLRTCYLSRSEGMEFKSFTTSEESKNTFDCVTSHKRALTKEDSNRLSPFAPIVDRECWAIGSVASRFKIPFHAYKILSDKVFESGEICQQVKDKALFFSESLLKHFLETWSLEVPGPIEACDNLEKMSKDYSLHFTTSHKRKFRSLWSILLKKYSNEKEVLKKLDMDCFKEIKLSPKDKTSFLLEKMENLSTPFKSELKVKLDQSISPLKNAKCSVKFSENFEDDSMELSLKIRKEADLIHLKKALEKTDYKQIKNLLNGIPE